MHNKSANSRKPLTLCSVSYVFLIKHCGTLVNFIVIVNVLTSAEFSQFHQIMGMTAGRAGLASSGT